jgi:hypothetical protein
LTEMSPWMAGAPQMIPQPVTQGNWVDQNVWEAQFARHNSQPMDQQAIQAAIANNSTMMQTMASNNGTMPASMQQGAVIPPDVYMTMPMQTEMDAPPDSFSPQMMAEVGPQYAYEDQAQAQQPEYVDYQPQPQQEGEDLFLEAMMQQAQMGIFALPDREQESTPV